MEKRESSARERRVKCLMHMSSIPEQDAQIFTQIRWDKFRSCAEKWLRLDGDERANADKVRELGLLNQENLTTIDIKDEIGFHPVCYRRFTDKSPIEQAERRCQKKAQAQGVPKSRATTSSSSCDEPGPSPKKLRSTLKLSLQRPSLSTSVRKSSSVLPELCIICNKKDIFRTVQQKRCKEKLVQAETKDAGKLRQAAEMKADERILIHIRDKDCVAIEVRYHTSCYRNYTNFLTKAKQPESKGQGSDVIFGEPYQQFKVKVIDECIIKNQEIIRMTKLNQLFHEYIIKLHGPQAELPRTDRLKYRMRRDYPQLSFHTPQRRYKSEMVFVDSLPAETLLDNR